MYKKMAEILSEGKIGDYSLIKFTISDKDFTAHFRMGISNGDYIRLEHKGECVMSDTDMEKRTNYSFCRKAHGDVLIGGLGLGLIVLAIQENPKVNHITIIEKSKEVIELVGKQLPLNSKVEIINADVFSWKPSKEKKYNCIYMDIWNWINSDIYKKEMIPLTRKYCHYLIAKDIDPSRFMDCWAKKQAKGNMRL